MKRLAVINCKGQKRDVPCTAEEMYMPSYTHRTQVEFIKAAGYDAYIILSAKYGVLMPTDMIEPYRLILKASSSSKALQKDPDTPMLTAEQTAQWARDVMHHPIWDKATHVDFHLPRTYYTPLSPHLKSVPFTHTQVRYPQSLITTGHRYEELTRAALAGEPVDLSLMGVRTPSLYPEKARVYYHPKYPPFNGWARNLVKFYPEQKLDEGALVRVDKATPDGARYKFAQRHHKGWCCDPDLLENLIMDVSSGRWKVSVQHTNHKQDVIEI